MMYTEQVKHKNSTRNWVHPEPPKQRA